MRGLGLLGMEERVRRLGGASRSTPSRGEGPWLQAELPVAELDERNGHEANSHPVG